MYALKKVKRTVVTWTACTALVMDTLEGECYISGYHIYEHIWEATIGEVLDCRREPSQNGEIYSSGELEK